MYRKLVVIVLPIFLFAGIVRFINFPDRVNFGSEQGLSLALSTDYLQGNWSLLGLVNVQRSTTDGLNLFSGSLFNYSLVPLVFLFRKNVIMITACFALLNILTGVLIYLFVSKIASWKAGIFSSSLFLFNSYMINHSLFIWILNYLPLLGLITMFLLYLFWYRRNSVLLPLFLGLISGIGFNLEYFYIFTAVIVFVVLIIVSKNRMLVIGLFVIGAFGANLPMVLFDLRHDFYHVRTLVSYLGKVMTTPGEHRISYYHFLQFWPLMSITFGLLLGGLFKRQKLLVTLVLFIYIYINLTSPRVSLIEARGMGDATRPVSVKDLNRAARLIYRDNPKDFNIVFYPGADYRGYALRYFLTYIYGLFPNNVEKYPESELLYVFAWKDFNCQWGYPWEVSSFCSQGVKKIKTEKISEEYYLFKLEKL